MGSLLGRREGEVESMAAQGRVGKYWSGFEDMWHVAVGQV